MKSQASNICVFLEKFNKILITNIGIDIPSNGRKMCMIFSVTFTGHYGPFDFIVLN